MLSRPQSSRPLCEERWKLIEYSASGPRNTQLFDLSRDPEELENVAGQKEFAPVQRQLSQQLAEARKEFGDPLERSFE